MRKKISFILSILLFMPFIMTSCGENPEPVDPTALDHISILKEPDKVNYYVNDSVNFDGIEIEAYYKNNDHNPVDIFDCTIEGATTISKGDRKVTITYEGCSDSFMIYVQERSSVKSLKSVDVDVLPTKTNYLPGDEFDPTGMVVTARYSDGSILDVSELATIEGAEDLSTVGVRTVKVKYDGKFDTFEIYVRESEGLEDSVFGDNDEGIAFSNLVYDVLENHNYMVDLESYIVYHTDEKLKTKYFNLNNKAYYNYDEDLGFYGGFIYQKDQGFVVFRKSAETEALSIGSFYTTSLEHMASDIYDVVIENVLNAKWVQDEEDHTKFITTDYYSIATGCNFTGYSQTANLEAPENIIAEYKATNKFKLIVNFGVIYWDSEKGEMVNEPGKCTLNVTVGGVSDETLESYIKDPSFIFVAPTEWSETDIEYFTTYYGGVIPPFIDGVSYSMYFDADTNYKGTYLYVTDYSCGDLRESYRNKLIAANYIQVGNDDCHYRYVIEKGLRIINYDVYMTYHLPTESYNGRTYGYYYPQGEFYVEYIVSETTSVNTVSRYNRFIQDYVGEGVLPELLFGGEVTRVTNFAYNSSNPLYKFYQGTPTNFYIDDYNVALEDLSVFASQLEEYGFTDRVYNALMNVYNYFLEDKNSYVSITALDKIDINNYTGIVQIRCQLYAQDF